MVAVEAIRERLARGGVRLDGAMGTELERRGVAAPLPLWSAAALLSAPEVVATIHREYVAAGADLLVANTFRTNVRTLRAAGCAARGAELNRLAVALARAAAASIERQVLVAASVAPVEDCYRPTLVPDARTLSAEHAVMMQWLAAAGPDLVWIETINTIREAQAAAGAAADVGLPFAVSFVVNEAGDLLSGERLADAVAAVEPCQPLALGLNCIPPRGISALLPRLRAGTGRPVAVYAHLSGAPTPGWNDGQALTPGQYGALARQWRAAGAQIVGGCCGTKPAHIQALAACDNPSRLLE